MSQNYSSYTQVFHRKTKVTLLYVAVLIFFLWIWLEFRTSLSLVPIIIMVLVILLQARTVSFHDKYLSINSILRKRRIDYSDIDYIDYEHHSGQRRVGGHYSDYHYKYIRLTLTNGKKVKLKDFKEGDDGLQFKIKTSVKAVKDYY